MRRRMIYVMLVVLSFFSRSEYIGERLSANSRS